MQQSKQELLEQKWAVQAQEKYLNEQLKQINKKIKEERDAKTPVHLKENLYKVQNEITRLEDINENIKRDIHNLQTQLIRNKQRIDDLVERWEDIDEEIETYLDSL